MKQRNNELMNKDSMEIQKIDSINQRMDEDYEYIMGVLGYFHNKMVENPNDVSSNEALLALGEVAQKMLATQIAYIDVSCNERSMQKLI